MEGQPGDDHGGGETADDLGPVTGRDPAEGGAAPPPPPRPPRPGAPGGAHVSCGELESLA